MLPTNLYLWAWRFTDLGRHDYPYYLYEDEIQALGWLRENAEPDDTALSSLALGQYIPAISGSKAFLAHWAQTVDLLPDMLGEVGYYDDAMVIRMVKNRIPQAIAAFREAQK